MISSGDSGSGYTSPQCDPMSGEAGKAISGTVLMTKNATAGGCCEAAQQAGTKAAGWNWDPPAAHTQTFLGSSFGDAGSGTFSFKDAVRRKGSEPTLSHPYAYPMKSAPR